MIPIRLTDQIVREHAEMFLASWFSTLPKIEVTSPRAGSWVLTVHAKAGPKVCDRLARGYEASFGVACTYQSQEGKETFLIRLR